MGEETLEVKHLSSASVLPPTTCVTLESSHLVSSSVNGDNNTTQSYWKDLMRYTYKVLSPLPGTSTCSTQTFLGTDCREGMCETSRGHPDTQRNGTVAPTAGVPSQPTRGEVTPALQASKPVSSPASSTYSFV